MRAKAVLRSITQETKQVSRKSLQPKDQACHEGAFCTHGTRICTHGASTLYFQWVSWEIGGVKVLWSASIFRYN